MPRANPTDWLLNHLQMAMKHEFGLSKWVPDGNSAHDSSIKRSIEQPLDAHR